ncbi:MAG: ABC transporter permease [Hyphomicrobiaceae bacterium]
MSASYDNPYLTGGSRPADSEPEEPVRPVTDDAFEQGVPARAKPGQKATTSAPIVPAGSVTGNSLMLVIAIMCFLACLTAGVVYLVNQTAAAWMRDVGTEVTVQIQPEDSVEATEKLVSRVAFYLGTLPGLNSRHILSLDESAKLLEPWLGQSEALKQLPLPRLIAVEIDASAPPDLAALNRALAAEYPDGKVSLDDHHQWQSQIRTVTRFLAIAGLGVLLLVGTATVLLIVSATRSAMASNREIVEVLHFVGATDRFIAREFERHFLSLGIKAGLVGAGAAAASFFLMPVILPLLGGSPVTDAQMGYLVGTGSLDLSGYALLGIVVIVVAALCMLTSRYGVFRILNARD